MTRLARTIGVLLVWGVAVSSVIALRAQTSRGSGLIEWGSGRKLTPNDFKGRIPSRSTDASRSWVFIDATWECQDGIGASQTRAVFDSDRSWWKDPSPNLWRGVDGAAAQQTRSDPERALLAHEQLHFDLTEVWARKVRAALADLPVACKTREGVARMEAAIATLERGWREAQARYDRETDHGADARRQAAWEASTRKTLTDDYPSAAR
jgi:hypothetical protein